MSEREVYNPPAVWTWNKDNGGQFAAINRPVAGPTHDAELNVGDHPLQLYSLATPNGVKVTIMLEELLEAGHSGAEYDAWFIDIGEGDQFSSGFVEINPNSKIPAMVDYSGESPIRLFESGSILLYLADKFAALLPTDTTARAEALNWLFWQMGSGPYLGGGFGHFYAYAPAKMEYPIDRFTMEVKRQLSVLEKRLAEKVAQEPEDDAEENVGPNTLPEAQETIAELNERIVRLTADFDNFRKRAQRDKDEARQFANQGLLEKLLPVLDNFEMALTAVKDADPSVRDGVQMILDQLLSVLKESGVVPVDALGQPFDPNLHEALSQEETTDAEEGTVVQQVQCGYKLNDRLVRPARVVVAKAPRTAGETPTED